MTDYNINAVKRRTVQSGSAGLGPYNFTFEILSQTDIAVHLNSTLLTLTSDYTVSINSNGTGSVTIVTGTNVSSTPQASDDITIIGARDIERTTDFVTAGDLTASSLNEQLDSLTIFDQQISERTDRALIGSISDPTTLDMTLPTVDNRKGKYLAFNSTSGAPEAGPSTSDVNTLASVTSDIATLADIQDGTTATNAITTVSGISANVTTVAGISSNVTTVAGMQSNVAAVVADATDIGTVASNISNVNSVAAKSSLITSDFVSDLNALAVTDVINDINTLATSDIVSDLNTLATSDIVSDLNTLATSDIVSDINTLATSDIVTDLNLLATSDFVSDLNTMATSSNVSDLNTVAGAITNINTTATNISGVNSFAERYRVGSSDPTTSLNPGDLFFNTSTSLLKRYNGSAWITIASGLTSIAGDSSPALGGNLDVNGNSIVSASNGNISITPNGSGKVILDGLSHPTSDGSAGQFLKTDGGGNLSFGTVSTDLVSDTTPQLGGDLDLNNNNITGTGNIPAANLTGTLPAIDGSNLTGIAAGATGGGSDQVFYENGQTVTTDYTITNGKNAMSAGPITINSGVTVTVGSGETYTVV